MRGVAIVGNYGTGNLGDEATLTAIVQHVRRRRPDAAVRVLSFAPGDTEVRHGLPSFAARPGASRVARLASRVLGRVGGGAVSLAREVPFAARALAMLRGVDRLVVGGSGQLIDHFGGPWGFPYLLCSWATLARLAGARVAFVSVGAGPLDAPLSRRLAVRALRLSDYRSFRDAGSLALVESLGVRTGNTLVPDVVFGLETPAPAPRPPSARLRVAINLFPHHDPRFWPGAEPARYRRYLGEMAAVVAWLAAEGHSVRLFPTHLRADPRCAADLRAVLASVAPGAAGAVVEADVRDVAGVVAEVAAADLVVAMRFHGILFSLLAGTPLIALSNHPKMDHLMRDHGQGDRVLSADTFTADDLARRLTTLAADRHGVSAAIRERTAEFRRRVTAQFDALFGAVAAPDPAALAGLARER